MKKPLTEEQVKELNALREVPGEAINTTDILPLDKRHAISTRNML